MNDNTIFDSVFKTMVHKAPRLLIPFINEVFGRGYPEDSEITPFSNEHESLKGTIIDDSVFRLQNKIYHVECQSTTGPNMVVRMVEYDFAIALEEALSKGAPYRLEFPASCVLYLRHDRNTPDYLQMEVVLPNGSTFDYQTKVVKSQLVELEALFRKRLLLLLPYYLMRYEQSLDQISRDDGQIARLIAECTEIRIRLAEQTLKMGDDLLYEQLTELIIRVSDYLTKEYESLQKKVRAAMGGEVLELLNDRAERLEREAEDRGLKVGMEKGMAKGMAKGMEKGIEQGVSELAKLLKSQGFDEDVIDKATKSLLSKATEEGAE